jgi:hypothetical protein
MCLEEWERDREKGCATRRGEGSAAMGGVGCAVGRELAWGGRERELAWGERERELRALLALGDEGAAGG